MFQMFGFGGLKCPRCEHKNADESGYCAKCGLTLGAPRNEPVLVENRWIAAPNELAVFFGVRALSGLFVKTLHVPVASRAYILQGDKATEVPQGEYQIETFFSRLNHLLRDQHAEILITRSGAMPLAFEFDDLHSAEHLRIAASLTVSVRIEQVPAFARHFMTIPGSVTDAHLVALLAPSVRQLAAEFVAARSMRDMAANPDLRAQLDERLQSALKLRLAQYGLAVVQVDTLGLRHDKYDANRERLGTLWLVADQGHVDLAHAKQLDQLYDDEQWRRIAREEQERRQRFRRAELHQDDAIERAELTLQSAERLQALRAREIDLFGRVAEAKNRKQALEHGAGDVLAALEHEHAKKGAAREDDSTEWAHLRELAKIRMRTEIEIAQQGTLEAHQLARQRFSQQLLQQQIDNKVAQARLIEDASEQRQELARLRLAQEDAARRQREIEAEEHKASWQSLALVNAAHKREAERIQEFEDQQALERQRVLARASSLDDEEVKQKLDTLRRGGAAADALAQHEKLLRTIAADGVHERQALQIQLDAEAARHTRQREAQEAQWQHELHLIEQAREDKFAQFAHAADLARIDIARAESIGAMSDTAKLALAAEPNAKALADYLKTQVHAGMSAQQLAALAGVVAAGSGVTPAEAASLAQAQVREQMALREAQADKDRRHQLDLLAMQNDVNKAALAAQSELGIGVAQGRAPAAPRQCANGHLAGPNDKFCAQCGAAIHP
ncbi:MAG: SPFH domain-containing protein [Massilia sp.]